MWPSAGRTPGPTSDSRSQLHNTRATGRFDPTRTGVAGVLSPLQSRPQGRGGCQRATHGGSMIRTNRSWRVAAAAIATGLTLAACGTTDDSSGDNGGTASGEPACDLKIAFMGALTGPAAGLGIAAVQGAELAVDQYNEKNPDCTVEFVKQDSQSDPKQAPGVAKDIIDDPKVIGLVGPLFSGESEAADPLFNEAGLPMITASATNPTLSEQGWKYFHRILGNDATQGPQVSKVLTDIVKSKKPFIVSDDSAYGQGLTAETSKDLGDKV